MRREPAWVADPVSAKAVESVPVVKAPCVEPGWRWGYCDENGDLILY